MPVSTIKVDITCLTGGDRRKARSDINTIAADAIQAFEELLKKDNCQLININMGDIADGRLAVVQLITVIWTGSSENIKSQYSVDVKHGLFGYSYFGGLYSY